MTTSDLIQEHLGERWWEREHDGTAILALVDRIMEEENFEFKNSAAVCIFIEVGDQVLKETGNPRLAEARGEIWYSSMAKLGLDWRKL